MLTSSSEPLLILTLTSDLKTKNLLCCLQESVEALPSSQPLFVFTCVPRVHGLHDLSIFPHGFLAVDHYLQQYSNLSSGKNISPVVTVNPCFNCDLFLERGGIHKQNRTRMTEGQKYKI